MSLPTLGDLLLEESRLRPLTEGAVTKTFRGACSLDEADGQAPEQWLVIHKQGRAAYDPGMVTGLRNAAGIVWLGSRPPAELLASAARLGIAVLHGGRGVTGIELLEAVKRVQVKQPDLKLHRRLRAIDRLNPSLLAEKPEVALVERYAAMTGESVAVISQGGKVLAHVGDLPSRTIARRLVGESREVISMSVGRWAMIATSLAVSYSDRAMGQGIWLVRGMRNGLTPSLEDPTAIAVADLLLLYFETKRRVSQDLFAGSTLFLERFTGEEADREKMEEFLASRGFSPNAALRLAVGARRAGGVGAETVRKVADMATQAQVPFVIGQICGVPALLSSDSDSFERIAIQLRGAIGVSAPFHGMGGGLALRQAKIAAHRAEVEGVLVKRIDDCGPVVKAASLLDERQLGECVRNLDDALSELKDAREIVIALVAAGFSTGAAAKKIGVHPNTVRNRLEKIRDENFTDADFVLWEIWRNTAG